MANFLITFGVVFLAMGVTTLMLFMGRSPIYRPSQGELEALLTRLLEHDLSVPEWDFFLGLPIRHDAQLEQVRLACVKADEAYRIVSNDVYIRLHESGEIKIRHQLLRLQKGESRIF